MTSSTDSRPRSLLQLPTLDNSAATNFNKCERLHDLTDRKKLLPARSDFENPDKLVPIKSAGLAFGDLMHIGLAHWHANYDPNAALDAMLQHPFQDPYDDYRTKEKALRLLAQYFSKYGKDPQWEVIFTETAFEVVDPSIDFKWGGRIDLVVRWQGRLWIVDHKTTSAFDKNWWDQFFPDTQTAGYTWAASHLHGEPIYGAIVNMLQVNNNKKEKTLDELFQRRWFVYEPYHIEEFLHQSRSTYSAIADRAASEPLLADAAFRPRWSSCVSKYGRCAWYEYCRLRPENRPRFLANETVPNEWNFRDI